MLSDNLSEKFECRRVHLKCNGVETCEFVDPQLFAGCERYEPDSEATRELWNHELDANEREAASASTIISQYVHSIFSCFEILPPKILSSGLKFEMQGQL